MSVGWRSGSPAFQHPLGREDTQPLRRILDSVLIDMAETSISRDALVKLDNFSCASGADLVQPATRVGDLQPDQPVCSEVQKTTYLKRDPGGDFVNPKDATKRKRVNRIAKLKQCKLDARRVQWLSQSTASPHDQGTRCRPRQDKQDSQQPSRRQEKQKASADSKSGDKESPNETECEDTGERFGETNVFVKSKSDGFFSGRDLVTGHSQSVETMKVGKGRVESPDGIPQTKNYEDKGSSDLPSRSDLERPWDATAELLCLDVNVSRTNLLSEGRREGWRQGCSLDPLSCPSGGSLQTSNNFESGEVGSDRNQESEEDWEVAADALHLTGSALIKVTSQLSKFATERKDVTSKKGELSKSSETLNRVRKPEYKGKSMGPVIHNKDVGGRAWRPDDLARPPTLPRLGKQHNFPLESSASVWSGLQQSISMWGPPRIPSYCPICTEELDGTDTSFFPCSCGFRLCLFCHHRISSDDGRCPGCRQAYCPDLAVKLSRTTTFWLRV